MGIFGGIGYLKRTHSTFRKRTRRDVCCWENFRSKCPKDLGVRTHVTETAGEYICARVRVRARKRNREEEEADLSSAGANSPNEWPNIYSSRCVLLFLSLSLSVSLSVRSFRPFTAVLTIPNSNTSGFIPASSRGNRDYHRVRLNEGEVWQVAPRVAKCNRVCLLVARYGEIKRTRGTLPRDLIFSHTRKNIQLLIRDRSVVCFPSSRNTKKAIKRNYKKKSEFFFF